MAVDAPCVPAIVPLRANLFHLVASHVVDRENIHRSVAIDAEANILNELFLVLPPLCNESGRKRDMRTAPSWRFEIESLIVVSLCASGSHAPSLLRFDLGIARLHAAVGVEVNGAKSVIRLFSATVSRA